MCTNQVDYGCQILSVFTPFNNNYHKEATTNTPSFDEADLCSSLSRPSLSYLLAAEVAPKIVYGHLFYTLAVKIATLNGVASRNSCVPIRRLPIMMLPW